MLDTKFLDDIGNRINRLIQESPAGDLEKNMRAMLQSAFSKLDLVTREEFDTQTQVLQKAREQLLALEARVAELESRKGE
jgi:BMFP domain-containing protein YqiC